VRKAALRMRVRRSTNTAQSVEIFSFSASWFFS
jgi:hypothetical protein